MTQYTPEVEEIVEEFREKFISPKDVFRDLQAELSVEGWLQRTLTTLLNQAEEEKKRAVEEERERIHQAFLNEFAGAGELWFPYVSEYDNSITKEDTIRVAQEYWENIMKALTPTISSDKTDGL